MPTIGDLRRIELEEHKASLRRDEEGGEVLNPFADQSFNNCNPCEPFELDDIPNSLGLQVDDYGNISITVEAPPVEVLPEPAEVPSALWKKKGRHIYNKNYRDGCVGMGTNNPDEDYKAHTGGDLLVRSGVSGTDVNVDAVGRE